MLELGEELQYEVGGMDHRRIYTTMHRGVSAKTESRMGTSSPLSIWGKGRISAAAWSPDGSEILVASARGMYFYDAVTLVERDHDAHILGAEQIVLRDTTLVTASNQEIALWQQDSRNALHVATHPHPPISLTFSPDVTLVAIEYGDGIRVCRIDDDTRIALLPTYSTGTQGSLAFSTDNSLLAVAREETIQLWALPEGILSAELAYRGGPITSLLFTADGQTLISASSKQVNRWRLVDGTSQLLTDGLSNIRRLAITSNGRFLVIASNSGLHVWDVATRLPLCTLIPLSDRILSLAFSPDDTQILAASCDVLQIWNLLDPSVSSDLTEHWGCTNSLAFSPSGRHLAMLTDHALLMQDTNGTPQWQIPLLGQAGTAGGLAFSPDSTLLAHAINGYIQLRQATDGVLRYEIKLDLIEADRMCITADGRLIAIALDGVYIWEVATGQQLLFKNAYIANADNVALAEDGRTLAVAVDRTVTIYDIETGIIWKSDTISIDINDIALVAKQGLIALASDQVTLIYQKDGKLSQRIVAPAQRVIFSPSGALLALVWGSTISLWEVKSGNRLAVLEGHSGTVKSVAFAPDGTLLTSGARDGTARLWQVPSHC